MKTNFVAVASVLIFWAAYAQSAEEPSTGPVVELFPIVQEGKWGYMDKAGKVSITPKYDCAWDFFGGMACVQVGLLRGYIDCIASAPFFLHGCALHGFPVF